MKKALQTVTLLAVALSALILTSCNNNEKQEVRPKTVIEIPSELYEKGMERTLVQPIVEAKPQRKTYSKCDGTKASYTDYVPTPRNMYTSYFGQGKPFDVNALLFALQHPDDYTFVKAPSKNYLIGGEPNVGGICCPTSPVQQGGGGITQIPTYPTGPVQDESVLQNPVKENESSQLEEFWDIVWPILLVLLVLFILYWLFKIANHADRSWTARKKLEYLTNLCKIRELEANLTKPAASTTTATPLPDNKDKVEPVPQTENKQAVVTEKVTTPNVPVLIEEVTVTEKIERTTVTKKFI